MALARSSSLGTDSSSRLNGTSSTASTRLLRYPAIVLVDRPPVNTSPRASVQRPENVWSNLALSDLDSGAETGSSGMWVSLEAPATLDALGRMLHPLFCVSMHEHACGIWRVGRGGVFEALWGALGLGSRAGRVCVVCILQAGFRVQFSSTYVHLCSSSVRLSEGGRYENNRIQ